jgi:hypothetical protein
MTQLREREQSGPLSGILTGHRVHLRTSFAAHSVVASPRALEFLGAHRGFLPVSFPGSLMSGISVAIVLPVCRIEVTRSPPTSATGVLFSQLIPAARPIKARSEAPLRPTLVILRRTLFVQGTRPQRLPQFSEFREAPAFGCSCEVPNRWESEESYFFGGDGELKKPIVLGLAGKLNT